jgi:uncharacterized protein
MSSDCLKFYLTEKQRHNGKLLYEWLLEEARKIGIEGGSVFRSIAGYGRHGQMHDESFFELAGELPIQVEFVLDAELADKFIAILQSHQLNLFYMRYSVISGYL